MSHALEGALKTRYPDASEIAVAIDRETGVIDAVINGRRMNPEELGRIAAQTAKELVIRKIRHGGEDIP